MTSGPEGERLVRALHRIWSTGDEAAIPEVYAEDFVGYWPASSPAPIRAGRAAVRDGLRRVRLGFPDWREDVHDIFAAGDRVASRFVASGVHLGPFGGLEPTGRRVEIQEISTFRIAGGRIVEQWCAYDELARLRQIGADAAYLQRLLGASGG